MNQVLPQGDNFFSGLDLTTLESVEKEVGQKASQILLEKIKDRDTDSVSEYLVQPKLRIRKSCGC